MLKISLLIVGLLLVSSMLFAANLLENGSFEDPGGIDPNTGWGDGTIPKWVPKDAFAACFEMGGTSGNYFGITAMPDGVKGVTIGYESDFYQIIKDHTLQAGKRYTLSFSYGKFWADHEFKAELLAGDTPIISQNLTKTGDYEWLSPPYSGYIDIKAGNSLIGSAVTVKFTSVVAGSGYAFIDNVVLEATDIPPQANVNLNITLDDLDKIVDRNLGSINVEILAADKTTVVETITTSLNTLPEPPEAFVISRLLNAGDCFIKVSAPKWLTKIAPVTVVADVDQDVNINLLNGDINGDGKINVSDYNRLKSNWFKVNDTL